MMTPPSGTVESTPEASEDDGGTEPSSPASGLVESTTEASEGDGGAEPSFEGEGLPEPSSVVVTLPPEELPPLDALLPPLDALPLDELPPLDDELSAASEFAGVADELTQPALANKEVAQRTMRDRLLMAWIDCTRHATESLSKWASSFISRESVCAITRHACRSAGSRPERRVRAPRKRCAAA